MTDDLPSPAPRDSGEFLLFESEDGRTCLEVRLSGKTVWLSLNQMASLFQRDKSVISCQWAPKGDQRKALERRPVGLRRDELLRWVLCRRQAPGGESSWRTDWRWISHRESRV